MTVFQPSVVVTRTRTSAPLMSRPVLTVSELPPTPSPTVFQVSPPSVERATKCVRASPSASDAFQEIVMSVLSAIFAPAAGAVTSTAGALPERVRCQRAGRVVLADAQRAGGGQRRDAQRERGVGRDGVLVARGGLAADRAHVVADREVAGLQDGAAGVELLEAVGTLARAGVGLALDLGHVAGDDRAVGLDRAGQRQRLARVRGGREPLLGGRAHRGGGELGRRGSPRSPWRSSGPWCAARPRRRSRSA